MDRPSTAPVGDPDSRAPETSATRLIEEALKKSALIWVATPQSPRGQALWHIWLDGQAFVLVRRPAPTPARTPPGQANLEQPDPGLHPGDTVSVLARSKDNAHRLLSFAARAELIDPSHPDWPAVTEELAKARLNLRDAEVAPARWAADPDVRVFRLTPTGELGEGPGSYHDSAHRAAPVPTTATTAGPPPRVLHRRGDSGRALS